MITFTSSNTHQSRPIVIGLMGGIGSGKSTLCNLFAKYGVPTIDTDVIARQMVQPGSTGLQAIKLEFGEHILNADKTLNRTQLRDIIFNNPNAKIQLESILHPLIHQETERQITALKSLNEDHNVPKFILIAIPLLTEIIHKDGGKPSYVDKIWVLDTPRQKQIDQACLRDNTNRQQIENIIQQQASPKECQAIADLIIHNDQTLEALQQQVSNIMQQEPELNLQTKS